MKRIRFSLRSLLLLVFMIGGAMGLWWRWEPWPELRVFNPVTGEQIEISGGRFSPDSKKLLCLGSQSLDIWDPWRGTLLRRIKVQEQIREYIWTPDSKSIVLGNVGNHGSVWDVGSGAQERSFDAMHPIGGFRFSPDGTTLMCRDSGAESIWNFATGKCVFPINYSYHDGKFSSDGKYIEFFINEPRIPGEDQSQARCGYAVVEAVSGREVLYIDGRNCDLSKIRFSEDSRRLCANYEVSDSDAGRTFEFIREWDIHSGTLVLEKKTGEREGIGRSKFDWPSSIWSESTSQDRSRRVTYKWKAGERLTVRDSDGFALCTLNAFRARTTAARADFSPDGNFISARGCEGGVRVWRKRRPEQWWGAAWLPEFWIAASSGLGLILSLRRDWRERARKV